jgi:iron complex transport system permease protein
MKIELMTPKKLNFIIWLLIFVLVALIIVSLCIGPTGWQPTINNYVVLKYRWSRILLSIIAGSSLAASGASLQAIFRNALADPYLFGISGGAALGAAIVIGFFAGNTAIMPSAGAIFGALSAFIIIFFYVRTSREPSTNCLLVGILINSLASSIITVLKTTLPMQKTQSLLFWLVGNINAVESTSYFLIIPLWIFGMSTILLLKGKLEILSFGYDESFLLGIHAERIIKIIIIANCALIGNVVAFAGMIGFLGLVVPHLARLSISADLRFMLPIASIAGAIFLVIFDTLSRLSFAFIHSEIPMGALSALILAPIFFLLLLKSARDVYQFGN